MTTARKQRPFDDLLLRNHWQRVEVTRSFLWWSWTREEWLCPWSGLTFPYHVAMQMQTGFF